jgi:hypothetical protein|tara:strand:+ start:70 stop:639 length:570 start_codon:yes stop_codon:yes gene_type:complete
MLVIDDFLPEQQFKTMQSSLLGNDFPWYFLPTVSRPPGSYIPLGSTETFGWFHNFYSKEDNINSPTIEILKPLLDGIQQHDNADFIRIRASLKTHLKGFTENDYNLPHVDYNFPHMSVIYYLNKSDGDTWMFNEVFKSFPEPDEFTVNDRITPKPNRLLVFNGLNYHTASNPINSNTRFIININYIQGT